MDSWLIAAYSPGDSEFTLQLSAQLKNRGFPIFLDITDAHTLSDEQASQLYQRASGLIAVLTREFLESSFGRAELAAAARHGCPVFMIALRTVPVELLPRGMTLQGALDFSGWRDERRFRAQLERLITAIAVQTGQRPRPPDGEMRYLNDLIAHLEAHKSTVEFEPINRSIHNPRLQADRRPLSALGALWGVNSRLRLIVPPTDTSGRIVLPVQTIGEALAQVRQAVLIGEPGCGASSMMKRLALDIAYQNRQQIAAQSAQARFPLPIVIDLGLVEAGQSIREHIQALWGRYAMQSDPLELLRLGGALLMLDGLDEPGAFGDARAAELRAWLASDDAPSYLVVTCRSDHASHYDLGLAQIECLPMNEAGTRRLIEAALGDHAHDLLSKVADAEALPAAIRTLPAHLLTLIRLYKHEPAHELPTSLGRLYRRLIASLWTARADSDDPIRISFQELTRPLSALAVAILDGQLPQAVQRGDAIRVMQGEALVDEAIRSGILSMTGGRVRFASRWLLDAFAALYLTPADVIPRLSNARVDDLGRRLGANWDQALILYAGVTPVPDVVVREIAEVDPLLASRCIDSGVRVSASVMHVIEEGLAGMMKMQQSGVSLAAAHALSSIGRTVNPATLIAIARSGDWAARAEAVHVLLEMPLRVPPPLLDALRDWDWSPDASIAEELSELRSDALPMLLHMLRDESEELRRGAAWGLGVIGDEAALAPLVNTLTDPDPLVKTEAVRALGRFNDPGLVPPLLRMLNEPYAYLRTAALESLRHYPDLVIHQADAILTGAQFNREGYLALIELLADFNAPSAVQHIIPLAQHSEPALRAAAARALGRLRDPNTIDLLRTLLEDDSLYGLEGRHVCDDAVEALRAFDHPYARQIVQQWMRTRPSEYQLRQQREDEQRVIKLIDELSLKLRHPDPARRADAVYQIARQDHLAAVPHLARAVHDKDMDVRRVAVRELRRYSANSDALNALAAALRDETLIDDAIAVLVHSGEPAARVLHQALDDEQPTVRAAAVDALTRLTSGNQLRRTYVVEDLIPKLEQMRADPAPLPFEGETVGQRCQTALETIDRWLSPMMRTDAVGGSELPFDELTDDVETHRLNPVEVESFVNSRYTPAVGDAAETADWPEGADLSDPADETAEQPEVDLAGAFQDEPQTDPAEAGDEAALPAISSQSDAEPSEDTEPLPVGNVTMTLAPDPAREGLASWPDLDVLLDYLTDSDNAMQIEASQRLMQGVRERAAAGVLSGIWLDTLLAQLDSPVNALRHAVLDAIAELRAPQAIPTLIHLLSHSNALTRRTTVATLDRIADPDSLRAVIPLLNDPDWGVRETVCRLIVKRHEIIGEEAIPGLEAVLARPEDRAFWDLAMKALGLLGSVRSMPLLLSMAQYDDLYLRTELVLALGRLRSAEAIPTLVQVLTDTRPAAYKKLKKRIDELAAEALLAIGTAEAHDQVNRWRSRAKL
jgi:HEAT repeat protein